MRVFMLLLLGLPAIVYADTLSAPGLPQYTPQNIPAVAAETLTPPANTSPPPADVANMDHPLAAVLAAMKQGRWSLAQQRVHALLAATPTDMDALFLAGQIAEQLQQPQQAAAYYRQMLAQNPQLPRPRLELAKVLWQAGEAEAAEHHFRLAQSLRLPENVARQVDHYLLAIKRQRLSWYISASLAPGNNINQGSIHQTVEIDDKIFTLSDSSRAQAGVGLHVNAGGQYRFGPQRQWFSTLQLSAQEYAGRQSDSLYGRLMLGKNIDTGSPRRQLQAAVGIQHVQYQQRALYSGAVVQLDYSQQWGNNTQWFAGWEAQQLHYRPEYAYLRAQQHWLSGGINIVQGGRTRYQAILQAGSSRAQEKAHGFETVGLSASVQHMLNWQQLTVGAKVGYSHTRYRGTTAFFEQTRQEQQYTGQLSLLKRNWSWHGFAPELALQYSRNRANIALYDRHSRQIRFTLNKVF